MNTCHADVIIKLHSGVELRATRTWTEGDTLKAQVRSGVIGLPLDSIAAMTEVAATAPAVRVAPEAAGPVAGASSAPVSSAKTTNGAAKADARGATAPAADTGAEHVPDVPGEDSHAKMERLDALSLKTYRDLSIARTQGQPQEALDALQRRIDDINTQREATMRSLGQLP